MSVENEFSSWKRIAKIKKEGYLVRLPETDTDNNGVDEKSRDDDYSVIATTCIFSSSKPERLEMGASLT